jgi:hypothetical protein
MASKKLQVVGVIKGELPGEHVGECTQCGTPLTKVYVMSDGQRLGCECMKKATGTLRLMEATDRNERESARLAYLHGAK